MWGYERDWKEIAHPEALGLALHATRKRPSNPIDFICDEFDLSRRHESTLAVFASWIKDAESLNL